MVFTAPSPRAPVEDARPRYQAYRQWYEDELGWVTAYESTADTPGSEEPGVQVPRVQLPTGLRFDVLELPAEAGFAVLRRVPRTGPVAVEGHRMRLLVAAGSAEELPELLSWLEWHGIPLDLKAIGAGGRITAPAPVTTPVCTAPAHKTAPAPTDAIAEVIVPCSGRPGVGTRTVMASREAALWLRPPEPGCEVEPTLPATGLGTIGSTAGAPDLVRLVDAAATECHRVRLRRTTARASVSARPSATGQALAFS
jgi:hypothetical protein